MADSLAQILIKARKRRGFSQEELAEAAQLNLRTVQRVEKGTHTPRGFTLQRLAAALRIELEDLTSPPASSPARASEPAPTTVPVGPPAFAGKVGALTVLYLSAFSYVLLPGANVVLPLLLWRQYRHHASVAEQGRALLNFEVLWTLVAFGGYGLLLAAQVLLLLHTEWVMVWTPIVFLLAMYAGHGVLLLLAIWQGHKGHVVLQKLGWRLF